MKENFTQEEIEIINEMAEIYGIPLIITNGYDDESTDLNEPHFYNTENGEHITIREGMKKISQEIVNNNKRMSEYVPNNYLDKWIVILDKVLKE